MYFTDLTNEELQLYHKIAKMDSVSLDLELMQGSSLFKVQSLGNNLYKIYPLFYVDEITCNADNVKVLDNKCVILLEKTTPTFINFITKNASDSSYVWSDTYRKDSATPLPVFDVGDTVDTAHFNNLVQVLRDNVPFYDPIHIKNGLINGTYGDYTFNITDATILDKGILISEETISNDLTVRLNNPRFEYSTYTLLLDVVSIEDINLLSDYSTENTHHTPLEVELTPNEAVTIPLSDLDFNTVIDFDAQVKIEHNKPYLTFTDHLDLQVTNTGYAYDNVTLTATYDTSGTPKANETITFYDGETTLGTATTNSNGVATLTYTPPTANKYYDFQATSNTVNSVIKQTYLAVMNPTINSRISMVNSSCPNTLPNSVSYIGFVSVGNRDLSGITVNSNIKKNNTIISSSTTTTVADGSFRDEITIEDTGELTFTITSDAVTRDGETMINSSTGATKTQTLSNKKPTTLSATLIDDDSGYSKVKGYLEDATLTHIGIYGKTLKVMYTDGVQTYIKSVVTAEGGFYYASADTGFNTTSVTVSFDGDCEYQGSTQTATRS